MTIKPIIINCFSTDAPNSGNPAAVLLDFEGDTTQKQALAKQLNQPVTTFINSQDQTFNFEFFYPEKQTNLCLHGALAGATILFKKFWGERFNIVLSNHDVLKIKRSKDLIQAEVSTQTYPKINIELKEILSLLNLESEALIDATSPLRINSIGSPKLLIPIISKAALENINPNLELIKTWSSTHKINGLYVYTQETEDPKNDVYARAFNPLTGLNEDIATGVAAAALSLQLKKSLNIEQGQSLHHPSLINVEYHNPQSLWVGGKTTIN